MNAAWWAGIIGALLGGAFTLGAQWLNNQSAFKRLKLEHDSRRDEREAERGLRDELRQSELVQAFTRSLSDLKSAATDLAQSTPLGVKVAAPAEYVDAARAAAARAAADGNQLAMVVTDDVSRALVLQVARDVAKLQSNLKLDPLSAAFFMGAYSGTAAAADRALARFTTWWGRSEQEIAVHLGLSKPARNPDGAHAVHESEPSAPPNDDRTSENPV